MLTGQELRDIAEAKARRGVEARLGFSLELLPDTHRKSVLLGIEEGISAAYASILRELTA